MSTISPEKSVAVPDWVRDHDSFRQWARSDEYPERGQFSWLGGELWVDLFGHSFRLTAATDPLGRPQFTLESQ